MKIKFSKDDKNSKVIKCNGGVQVYDDNGNDITAGLTDLIIVSRANDVVRAVCTYIVSDIEGLDGVEQKEEIDITDMESVALEFVKNPKI